MYVYVIGRHIILFQVDKFTIILIYSFKIFINIEDLIYFYLPYHSINFIIIIVLKMDEVEKLDIKRTHLLVSLSMMQIIYINTLY